jgi:type IV pilus assembly protein PilQ
MKRYAIILLIIVWLMLGAYPSFRSRAGMTSQAATLKSDILPASPAGPAVTQAGASILETSAQASSGPLRVSNVSVNKLESGETCVDVSTSRSASYRVTALAGPARLVVDIDDARNTAARKSYAADTPVLKDVRIAQFSTKDPAVVRVVADLNGNPAFEVHASPTGVCIELRPRAAGKSMLSATSLPVPHVNPAPTAAPNRVAAAKAPLPATVTGVILKPVVLPDNLPELREVKLDVRSTLPMMSNSKQVMAAPASVTLPDNLPELREVKLDVRSTLPVMSNSKQVMAVPASVTLPANLPELREVKAEVRSTLPMMSKSKQVMAAPASVTLPANLPELREVKAEVRSTLPVMSNSKQVMAAPAPAPARPTPEVLRAEHASQILKLGKDAPEMGEQGTSSGNTIGPPEAAKPVYTGEPISLNLKDVDLKDFFRLIHEISGLNIIIDPDVSGEVTLVLDSVPWDQALEIVLKNNHLGKILEGNVLRIARMSTLASEQDDMSKLAVARMNAAPLVTVFRPINFAKAQDLVSLLRTWSGGKQGGALSPRGTVLADVRNNTLIISDVQSQIPIIESVVSKIDRKAKQISIEARVVLANADFTRTLSTALSGTGRNPSTSTQYGTATGSGASITPANSVPNSVPPLSGLIIPQNASSGFGTFAITNASQRYLINAVISAQEERDQAKTISRPTIVTQNNVQGMVQQGVQVPIQTSINNTVTVQYQDATLQLQVTPQVTSENDIFLIIAVQNASLGAVIAGANPSINTQQATTQVLVPDGGTVVFGGITVTSRSKAATYIPVLGSIPVLGNLFKNSNVTDQDQELLFFVSPKILPG